MILRRASEHVKHQQWTAVVIEPGIVVLGVCIHLQMNDCMHPCRDQRDAEGGRTLRVDVA